MNTNHPVEYLTLPAGSKTNYANMYPWRLLDPTQCNVNRTQPADGEDNNIYEEDPCEGCSSNPYSLAGQTNYTRVRINVTTLQVIGKCEFL